MEGVTRENTRDHRREEWFRTRVFRKKIDSFLENLRSEEKILTSEVEKGFSWRETLEIHMNTSNSRGNTSFKKYAHELLTEEGIKYLIKVNKVKLRKLPKTLDSNDTMNKFFKTKQYLILICLKLFGTT